MSVIFNGTNLESFFIVSDVARPLPEFRAASTRIDGADGESFDLMTLGPRECSFDLYAVDKSAQALQDAARLLTSIFMVREPKPLQFSDEKDPNGNQLRRYVVPVGSFDSEAFIRAGVWRCRFRSFDPFLYGISRSATLTAGTATQIDFGTYVSGRMLAPALVRATSTPSGSMYTIESGSGHIRYDAPFDGNTLVLDFEAQTATLSPALANASGLAFGSTFFPLTGTATVTASDDTALAWTDRWV